MVRVLLCGAVTALLAVAGLPRVAHASSVTYGETRADCVVDRLMLLEENRCPNYSSNVTGRASAVARVDAATRSFTVQSAASPKGIVPTTIGQRHGYALAYFNATATTTRSGHLKLVLDDLVGGANERCGTLCSQIPTTGSTLGATVFVSANGEGTATVCPITLNSGRVPSRLVIPDGCAINAEPIEVPANSTVDVMLIIGATSVANANGRTSASLRGRLASIEAP